MSEVSESDHKPSGHRHRQRYHRYYAQKRPVFITVLCLLLFIGQPLLWFFQADDIALFSEVHGVWHQYIYPVTTLLIVVSGVGLWRMRRWGLFLYIALFVISFGLGLYFGLPMSVIGFLVPLAIILSLCAFYKRMR